MVSGKDNSDPKKIPPKEREKKSNNYLRANFFSRTWFVWMMPTFWRGFKRDLYDADLTKPKDTHLSDKLGDRLEKKWLEEIALASKKGRKPSLLRAMTKAFWMSYAPSGIMFLIQALLLKPFQPVALSMMLAYWEPGSDMTYEQAVYCASAVILMSLVIAFLNHHGSYSTQQFGMKVRIAACSLIYRKVMRMSSGALAQTTAGQVVNLLSNDVNRFDYAFIYTHFIWLLPLQVVIVCYLIYIKIGYAAIIGVVGIVLQTIPVQSYMSKLAARLRMRTACKTDERVRIMDEIICGMQVIKMYAWEKPFQLVVNAARAYEMSALKKSIFIRSVFLGFMLFTERLIMFVTILTLILWNQKMISATTIYPIQQFLSAIQLNITMILPMAIASLSEMFVSLDRIQSFLVMDEREDLALTSSSKNLPNIIHFDGKQNGDAQNIDGKRVSKVEHQDTNGVEVKSSKASEYAVEIMGVTASWNADSGPKDATLKNLSVRIRRGKLCAVIGPVGSGKTSLLQLLLKELPAQTGGLKINGTLSYSCQESWLFPATVRENILFGLPYDSAKYKQVCRACCLGPDFEQFPYGDLSLVGERGVSLSGGQRARINLARAVYRDVDIYLLDDPLSAVDANVGRLLFDNCIRELLRERTCLLVTHQIHYLKNADQIIVLNEGGIENMGTYEELVKSGKDFALLLKELKDVDDDVKDETQDKNRPTMQRGFSVQSQENAKTEKEQVLAAEERAKGNLKWSVVWTYLRSVDSYCMLALSLSTLMITQAAATFTDYWLSLWTNAVNNYIQDLPEGQEPDPSLDTDMGVLTTGQHLWIYGGGVATIILFSQMRIITFVVTCMRASKNIHNKVFKNLITAIKRFFDTSPSGRILNRFSKDLGAVDELLPRSMLETLQMYLSMLSVLVLNALALPWTLVPTFLLITLFVFLLKWYLKAAQAVKRLEGTTKSPVFSMINSTITGLSTIRSSNSQCRLQTKFDQAQNLNSSAFYTFLGGSSAFGMYIDALCLVYLGLVMSIFILIDFGDIIPVGSVGLAVSQSMVLTMLLQMAARFTADFLAQMTAVERMLEYTNLPKEENLEVGRIEPTQQWPSSGHVTFENVFMRYGPSDPYVLKNLNIQIKDGWKVGVVGRTGAGKSSLISALFRLTDIEGSIKIDGVDTFNVAKKELRSKISIIPQEPVLFSATLRYNLDPFSNYSDDELWRALEQVELKDTVPALDFKVSEGGSNFSMGQRQLVCLARAILRSNKILIMDEATANVDPQTDALIQKTIRQQFASCTVITIAHRLLTVMDSDRVLVMDRGEAVEFDHPHLLLSNPNSHLNFLVGETSENMSKALYEMAKKKYFSENPQG
uniref:ABCC2 n=1 Tax=Cnaphalocrocis medinalis TaxID=437488 RepID=A0A223PQG6_CNAME|nr:ABCC2 [Cnaphalocrocis medinalis]